jgi:hypothetical protein
MPAGEGGRTNAVEVYFLQKVGIAPREELGHPEIFDQLELRVTSGVSRPRNAVEFASPTRGIDCDGYQRSATGNSRF